MNDTKLLSLAMAGGLVACVVFLALAGFSPVSGPFAALGVLTAAVGFCEGTGLMHLLYLASGWGEPRRGRPGPGAKLGLLVAALLGIASFSYLILGRAGTLPTLFAMGFGFGLFIGAGRNLIKTSRPGRRRTRSS